jgi:Helix-turn-helix domain
MSPADVSEMLGIPVHTLYRWRYRATAQIGYRVGRHVRYRREAVEACWNGRSTNASEHSARVSPRAVHKAVRTSAEQNQGPKDLKHAVRSVARFLPPHEVQRLGDPCARARRPARTAYFKTSTAGTTASVLSAAVMVSGGWNPAVHLFSHAGGKLPLRRAPRRVPAG